MNKEIKRKMSKEEIIKIIKEIINNNSSTIFNENIFDFLRLNNSEFNKSKNEINTIFYKYDRTRDLTLFDFFILLLENNNI
jgi:hypothetical protein